MRRLRVSHVVVQPVLVWDDGEELSPGPGVDPITIPLSELAALHEKIPAQLIELAAQLSPDQPPQ